MASPVKAGGPTHMGIIDQYDELELDACIKEALDGEGHDLFYVRVRAVRLVQLDKKLPKYRRLGMKRIASLLYVGRGSVHNWWKAFKIGGISALRNDTSGCGRSPKVSSETMEEIEGDLLSRSPRPRSPRRRRWPLRSRWSKGPPLMHFQGCKGQGGAGRPVDVWRPG